jgi:DNA-binding MarR family transcriptional regulator
MEFMTPTVRPIGYELIGLNNSLRRQEVEHRLDHEDGQLTSMQAMILNYLDCNRETEVFQKDLEQVFSIRRSTATGILKVMERDGYLVRRPVPQDARLKKLVLTTLGQNYCDSARRHIEQIEQQMRTGFTDDEVETLFCLLDRIKQNLEHPKTVSAAQSGRKE